MKKVHVYTVYNEVHTGRNERYMIERAEDREVVFLAIDKPHKTVKFPMNVVVRIEIEDESRAA